MPFSYSVTTGFGERAITVYQDAVRTYEASVRLRNKFSD